MSPFRDIAVAIHPEHSAALLSALRRGAAAEALELLDRWEPAVIGDCEPDLVTFTDDAVLALSLWLQGEVRLHVEAGRFQHALVLAERYIDLPQVISTDTDIERRLKVLHQLELPPS